MKVTYVLPRLMLELRYSLASDGGSPFEEWFTGLEATAAAKVTAALARLERGNVSNVRGVGEGVLEYRIDWGPGYLVYFGRDGDALVILLITRGQEPRPYVVAAEVVLSFVVADVMRDGRNLIGLLRSADLVEVFSQRTRGRNQRRTADR